MTDKLITHDEARTIAQDMLPKQVGSISSRNKVNKYFELDLYFKQQEQRDRDIARYFELKVITRKELHELAEFCELEDKRLDVGKEE